MSIAAEPADVRVDRAKIAQNITTLQARSVLPESCTSYALDIGPGRLGEPNESSRQTFVCKIMNRAERLAITQYMAPASGSTTISLVTALKQLRSEPAPWTTFFNSPTRAIGARAQGKNPLLAGL